MALEQMQQLHWLRVRLRCTAEEQKRVASLVHHLSSRRALTHFDWVWPQLHTEQLLDLASMAEILLRGTAARQLQ